MEDCENILEVHMELSYKLEKFEGPLDLLLHLIEKNKVNIYDIPIAEITDQYMEYVRQMDEENWMWSANFGDGGDASRHHGADAAAERSE